MIEIPKVARGGRKEKWRQIMLPEQTHRRLQALKDETGMPMAQIVTYLVDRAQAGRKRKGV